jgi:hypothetical protein
MVREPYSLIVAARVTKTGSGEKRVYYAAAWLDGIQIGYPERMAPTHS